MTIEQVKLGQYYTVGFNSRCQWVVITTRVVEVLDDGRIVTQSGGLRILGTPDKLHTTRASALAEIARRQSR